VIRQKKKLKKITDSLVVGISYKL